VSEINANGGVRGRRIELLPADDRGQAETAAQVAQLYRDNKTVVAVIGHAGNVTTLAAAPIYGAGDDPIAVISPSASSPDLSRAGPHVFRVSPYDIVHAAALAEWARGGLGVRTAAILYQNDPESRTTAAAFRREFTERGGLLIAEDPFSHALPSFEPYLTRAAVRGGVQALLVVGGGPSIGAILATLDSVGARPAILGNSDLLGFVPTASGALEGAFLSTAYLPNRGGAPNESFVTAFRQTHGGQLPDPTAAGSYDAVYLIARAIAAQEPTRAGIRGYLSGVGTETEPFEGTTGTIAFDENGDLRRLSVEVGVVRNGTLTPASEH
jgi:branched-chain amino acid transport system substrate-binding protein